MQKLILKLWNRIMNKYAKRQIEEIREELKELTFQLSCYRKLYNLLLVLFLLHYSPKVVVIKETITCLLLEIILENNKVIQLPLNEYQGLLLNIIGIPKAKDSLNKISFEESIDILHKYLITKVLKKYED